MGCTVYTIYIHYTVYSVQSTLYSVTLKCTVYTIYSTQDVQCKPLCLDETKRTTVRYWHDASGRIANVLIASHGIKRFDSEFCLHKCIEALDRYNLPLSRLVYVSSHSPDKDQIVSLN